MKRKQNEGLRLSHKNLLLRRDNEYDTMNYNVEIQKEDRFMNILSIENKSDYYEQFTSYLRIERPSERLMKEIREKRKRNTKVEPISVFKYDDIEPLLSPETSERPTVVLDLDRCILFTTAAREMTSCFEVQHEDQLFTSYRQYYVDLLKFCDEFFEIVIWSAGLCDYVRIRRDYLQEFVTQELQYLSRENCHEASGTYIKDLRKLGRNMENIVLVDDNFVSCTFQYRNCVPLREFEGQLDDELLNMIVLLKKLLSYSTIVHGIERQFE